MRVPAGICRANYGANKSACLNGGIGMDGFPQLFSILRSSPGFTSLAELGRYRTRILQGRNTLTRFLLKKYRNIDVGGWGGNIRQRGLDIIFIFSAIVTRPLKLIFQMFLRIEITQ
jgi:hypothetical protein